MVRAAPIRGARPWHPSQVAALGTLHGGPYRDAPLPRHVLERHSSGHPALLTVERRINLSGKKPKSTSGSNERMRSNFSLERSRDR